MVGAFVRRRLTSDGHKRIIGDMIDADGNLYAENCHYCGRGPDVGAYDLLRKPICNGCWPAVRDTLGRWGDMRGLAEAGCRKPQGRVVTEADRRVPRGAWMAPLKQDAASAPALTT